MRRMIGVGATLGAATASRLPPEVFKPVIVVLLVAICERARPERRFFGLLGVAFGICFVTGIISHLIQNPAAWFTWPARPAAE